MVRKHIKVEPQRWFYWADKLGLLVWQDMPAMDRRARRPPPTPHRSSRPSCDEMVDQHRSSPSIVQWVPFNEGWGEYDAGPRIADQVKSLGPDPAGRQQLRLQLLRLSTAATATSSTTTSTSAPAAPAADRHPGRGAAASSAASACGSPGHEWQPGDGFGYEMTADSAALTERYVGMVTDSCSGCMLGQRPVSARSTPRSPTWRTRSTASSPTTGR